MFWSHIGLSVADIHRSTRFYCDGLGFKEGSTLGGGPESSSVLGLPDVEFTNRFLTKDGFTLELVQMHKPPPEADVVPRPFNKLGFTHMAIRVSNLKSVAAKLIELGGSAVEETYFEPAVVHPHGPMTKEDLEKWRGAPQAIMFCLDPDGTRVELLEIPPSVSMTHQEWHEHRVAYGAREKY